MSTNTSALKVERVNVSFGGLRALNDVYLDIAKNEVVGISGVSAPVSAVPDDVFMVFAKSPASQAEIISATKKRFNGTTLPAYNKLSDEDKANAQKSTLYDIITKVDQTGFNLEGVQTPTITNIKIGEQNKKTESNFVNGLTDAINSGNKSAVEDYFGKFPALQGGKYTYSTYSDITNRKTGEPVEYLVYLKDSDGVELPEPVSLKRNDKDLFSKVAGTYQKLGGSSKNIELEAIDKPSPKPATPSKDNMISIALDGKMGTIPEKNWEAFKKKYPNAKRQ
jgi:hypothetical protein